MPPDSLAPPGWDEAQPATSSTPPGWDNAIPIGATPGKMAQRFEEKPRSNWETAGRLVENVANVIPSFAKTFLLDPPVATYKGLNHSADAFYGTPVTPTTIGDMYRLFGKVGSKSAEFAAKAFPPPLGTAVESAGKALSSGTSKMGTGADVAAHLGDSLKYGMPEGFVDVSDPEGKLSPKEREGRKREIVAELLADAALSQTPIPYLNRFRRYGQAALGYAGGRAAEFGMNQLNQEQGLAPDVPFEEDIKHRLATEPLNAVISLLGIPLATGTAKHGVSQFRHAAGKVRDSADSLSRPSSLLSGAITRSANDAAVRPDFFGEVDPDGFRNTTLDKAIETDLPELYEQLRLSGGSPLADLAKHNEVLRRKAGKDIDTIYERLPKNTSVTVGDVLSPGTERSLKGKIDSEQVPLRTVYDNEMIRIANERLDGVVTYYTGTGRNRKRHRAREGARFAELFNTDTHVRNKSRKGQTMSRSERQELDRYIRKIESLPLSPQELRNLESQFNERAKYKNQITDAAGADSVKANATFANNARQIKYNLVKQHLPDEVDAFRKANRRYAISNRVGELVEKRAMEAATTGRAVRTPYIETRKGEVPRTVRAAQIFGEDFVHDPEARIRAAVPPNSPLALEQVRMPLLRRGAAGVQRVASVVEPGVALLNSPAGMAMLAAARTENAMEPHPARSLGEWLGNEMFDAKEGLKGAYQSWAAPVAPPPPVMPGQPLPRDVSVLREHKEMVAQALLASGKVPPEAIDDVVTALTNPNDDFAQMAMAEFSKQVPQLFAPAEYASEMNGKLHDPVDKDDFEKKLKRKMLNGEISTREYAQRRQAVNVDGSINAPVAPDSQSAIVKPPTGGGLNNVKY